MEFIASTIPEVILIKPRIFGDARGFFFESYKKSLFVNNGIKQDFHQDNHSHSKRGVLRGLHYQIGNAVQAKLIRCTKGAIFDVAVDVRKSSPTFGKWVGYKLSEENKYMLLIPEGFAHGFLTISEEAEVLYKASNEYSVESERGVIFNDPVIAIEWPKLEIPYILSEKDLILPLLHKAEVF